MLKSIILNATVEFNNKTVRNTKFAEKTPRFHTFKSLIKAGFCSIFLP